MLDQQIDHHEVHHAAVLEEVPEVGPCGEVGDEEEAGYGEGAGEEEQGEEAGLIGTS